jgi:hypothetical protein
MSSHWGVTNGCVEIIHENGEKKYACKVCRLHGKRTPKNMAPRENQPRAEVVIDDSDDDDANNNNPDDAQVDPDDPNVLDDPNFTYTKCETTFVINNTNIQRHLHSHGFCPFKGNKEYYRRVVTAFVARFLRRRQNNNNNDNNAAAGVDAQQNNNNQQQNNNNQQPNLNNQQQQNNNNNPNQLMNDNNLPPNQQQNNNNQQRKNPINVGAWFVSNTNTTLIMNIFATHKYPFLHIESAGWQAILKNYGLPQWNRKQFRAVMFEKVATMQRDAAFSGAIEDIRFGVGRTFGVINGRCICHGINLVVGLLAAHYSPIVIQMKHKNGTMMVIHHEQRRLNNPVGCGAVATTRERKKRMFWG